MTDDRILQNRIAEDQKSSQDQNQKQTPEFTPESVPAPEIGRRKFMGVGASMAAMLAAFGAGTKNSIR